MSEKTQKIHVFNINKKTTSNFSFSEQIPSKIIAVNIQRNYVGILTSNLALKLCLFIFPIEEGVVFQMNSFKSPKPQGIEAMLKKVEPNSLSCQEKIIQIIGRGMIAMYLTDTGSLLSQGGYLEDVTGVLGLGEGLEWEDGMSRVFFGSKGMRQPWIKQCSLVDKLAGAIDKNGRAWIWGMIRKGEMASVPQLIKLLKKKILFSAIKVGGQGTAYLLSKSGKLYKYGGSGTDKQKEEIRAVEQFSKEIIIDVQIGGGFIVTLNSKNFRGFWVQFLLKEKRKLSYLDTTEEDNSKIMLSQQNRVKELLTKNNTICFLTFNHQLVIFKYQKQSMKKLYELDTQKFGPDTHLLSMDTDGLGQLKLLLSTQIALTSDPQASSPPKSIKLGKRIKKKKKKKGRKNLKVKIGKKKSFKSIRSIHNSVLSDLKEEKEEEEGSEQKESFSSYSEESVRKVWLESQKLHGSIRTNEMNHYLTKLSTTTQPLKDFSHEKFMHLYHQNKEKFTVTKNPIFDLDFSKPTSFRAKNLDISKSIQNISSQHERKTRLKTLFDSVRSKLSRPQPINEPSFFVKHQLQELSRSIRTQIDKIGVSSHRQRNPFNDRVLSQGLQRRLFTHQAKERKPQQSKLWRVIDEALPRKALKTSQSQRRQKYRGVQISQGNQREFKLEDVSLTRSQTFLGGQGMMMMSGGRENGVLKEQRTSFDRMKKLKERIRNFNKCTDIKKGPYNQVKSYKNQQLAARIIAHFMKKQTRKLLKHVFSRLKTCENRISYEKLFLVPHHVKQNAIIMGKILKKIELERKFQAMEKLFLYKGREEVDLDGDGDKFVACWLLKKFIKKKNTWIKKDVLRLLKCIPARQIGHFKDKIQGMIGVSKGPYAKSQFQNEPIFGKEIRKRTFGQLKAQRFSRFRFEGKAKYGERKGKGTKGRKGGQLFKYRGFSRRNYQEK